MKNINLNTLLLALGLLFLAANSFGQYNIGTFYNSQHDINNRMFTSELDLGKHHIQAGMNYYVWLGNNTFDYGSIQDLNKNKEINNAQVNTIISKLKGDNILGFGQDMQVFALAYQYNTPKDEKHVVFTLSVDDKVASNMVLSQNMAKLMWHGNYQFRGQTVQLDPFAINVNYIREYAFGSAFTIFGDEHEKELRVGIRAKYIQGIGSMYMTNKDFSIRTTSLGDTVAVGFNYDIKTSRANENFDLFNPAGKGYGFDLSLSYYPNSNLTFAASLTDLNFVTFDKDIVSYHKDSLENYTGAIVSNLFGDIKIDPNQLTTIFIPQITPGGSYKIPVSPKINLLAEFQQIITDTKKGDYAMNSVFLTYIQGFSNLPGTTVNPFIAGGYTHSFGHTLNLGMSTAYGGYNRFVFGPYASLYWSRKRISIGSDNLGGLMFSHLATGTDLTISFTATFF